MENWLRNAKDDVFMFKVLVWSVGGWENEKLKIREDLTLFQGKWEGEDYMGLALFISFKSWCARKPRKLESIGRSYQYAFLGTYCVWILMLWKAICNYQVFEFPSSRWLIAKGGNLEFIILNHPLPKWILKPHCRPVMIYQHRKRAIYFDLQRCSAYDICWNDF
jgi:hypothetical protein